MYKPKKKDNRISWSKEKQFTNAWLATDWLFTPAVSNVNKSKQNYKGDGWATSWKGSFPPQDFENVLLWKDVTEHGKTRLMSQIQHFDILVENNGTLIKDSLKMYSLSLSFFVHIKQNIKYVF